MKEKLSSDEIDRPTPFVQVNILSNQIEKFYTCQ